MPQPTKLTQLRADVEQARAALEEARRLHARYVATPGGRLADRRRAGEGRSAHEQALVMEIAAGADPVARRARARLRGRRCSIPSNTARWSPAPCSWDGRGSGSSGRSSAGGSYESLGLPAEMCAAARARAAPDRPPAPGSACGPWSVSGPDPMTGRWGVSGAGPVSPEFRPAPWRPLVTGLASQQAAESWLARHWGQQPGSVHFEMHLGGLLWPGRPPAEWQPWYVDLTSGELVNGRDGRRMG